MSSSKPVTLSVVLATYNEAEHLSRCLNSVKTLADEIVIVDGNSSDDTTSIAHNFHARVISTTNKPMFHTNKQMAIDAATGKWILQLDADEVVDTTLIKSIRSVINSTTPHTAYWVKRKNYFLGSFLTKGGQYPDPVIRFFQKGQASLPQKSVHEQMNVNGTVGWLEGHLLHYNAPSFSRYVRNANRYTSLTAEELALKKLPLTWYNDILYLIIKPMHIFFTLYLQHRGYVDGFPGFVFALFSGLHVALAYMKVGDIYGDRS